MLALGTPSARQFHEREADKTSQARVRGGPAWEWRWGGGGLTAAHTVAPRGMKRSDVSLLQTARQA